MVDVMFLILLILTWWRRIDLWDLSPGISCPFPPWQWAQAWNWLGALGLRRHVRSPGRSSQEPNNSETAFIL